MAASARRRGEGVQAGWDQHGGRGEWCPPGHRGAGSARGGLSGAAPGSGAPAGRGTAGDGCHNYAARGREWEPAGEPRQVKTHDFADKVLGKVAPYGVYDITTNTGWVNVGTDADTGQFAVESIRRWWTTLGAAGYPGARRLMITADSGGSNGFASSAANE